MFYRMIERKRDQWFASGNCTVRALVDYMSKVGQMRDAQVDAIKTYLFLKVACDCKPLHELFMAGSFNSLDIGELSLPDSVKGFLRQHPAAAALYEYASQTNDSGEQVSKKLQEQIAKDPASIDYEQFFTAAFYGVSYSDYLFSLPMGAGKTFLMDYGIAKHAEGNWLSNIRSNEDGRLYVRSLAWGRTPALPATSLVIGNLHLNGDNHLLSFKSLAGTLPIMLGDPRKLSLAERAEYREWAGWLKELEARHGIMSFRQDLPGFGEPQEGAWDGFARINTETKSGGLVGVFRHNAVERSRRVAMRGLDPDAKYAVLKGAKGERVAEMTGRELEEVGFEVVLPKRCDGELFEIARVSSEKKMLIHSHNDYAQKRPFWGAYEAGADSIEADVFLVDGELLVAHSRKDLKKENTLRRLYLEPLREVMRKNGGRAYADGKPIQLLIDLKNGKPALDCLVEMVEKEGYRDCFAIAKNPSAARLTVTGDHSEITDFFAYPDYVFFDVPPTKKLADEQYKRVPLISHYARAYTKWRSGEMDETDKEKIRAAVREAHAKGCKFRLWGYPDNPEAWRLARELGLDYINTDRPAAASAFQRNQ